MTPAPLYFTRQYLQARASDAGGPRGAEVVLAPARAEILRELGGVTAAVAGTHGKSSVGIRAGVVWINTPLLRELRAPFGGTKDSGFGRDGATTSAEFFTEAKTTSIPLGAVPMARMGLGLGGP